MEGSGIAPVPCARCRTRRVKCDRRTGGCLRCEKLSQQCPGYSRVRRFHDEGPILRSKFSKNQCSQRRDDGPNQLLWSSTGDAQPSSAQESPSSPDPFDISASHGHSTESVGAGSEAQSQESAFDNAYFDLDIDTYYAQENNSCGFAPHLLGAENAREQDASWPSDPSGTPQPSVQAFSETGEGPALNLRAANCPEGQLREALLIRHFVEVISPWLDNFDIDNYFGHTVPVNSLRSRMLRDTILAIAAKQLGNKSWESAFGGNRNEFMSVTELEMQNHSLQVDWPYEAASFYDRAIRQMVSSLQYIGISTDCHKEPSTAKNKEEQGKVDNLLLAVSIFLLYESLDSGHLSISQHMTGAQQLLQLVLRQRPSSTPVDFRDARPSSDVGITKAWRASFWNLASFDYINSYARKSETTLKFDDVRLWQASGLPMAEIHGQHVPSSLIRANGPPERMTETMACRTLIWVVLKALHYMFSSDQDSASHISENASHSSHWHQVDQHLKDWYAALPNNFEAFLRISQPHQHSIDSALPLDSSVAMAPTVKIPFPQLFYTNSMGATALLLYHFTRILIMLNKPPDDSRCHMGISRLQSHLQFSQQINHHAEEICGISVGRPQPGVQMHLVQPLCLAGLCLNSDERKIALVNLLVELQQRTGYPTKWGVIRLKEEWGWSKELFKHTDLL